MAFLHLINVLLISAALLFWAELCALPLINKPNHEVFPKTNSSSNTSFHDLSKVNNDTTYDLTRTNDDKNISSLTEYNHRVKRNTGHMDEPMNKRNYGIFLNSEGRKKAKKLDHRRIAANVKKAAEQKKDKSNVANFGDKNIMEFLERNIDKELSEEMKNSGVNDSRVLRNVTGVANAPGENAQPSQTASDPVKNAQPAQNAQPRQTASDPGTNVQSAENVQPAQTASDPGTNAHPVQNAVSSTAVEAPLPLTSDVTLSSTSVVSPTSPDVSPPTPASEQSHTSSTQASSDSPTEESHTEKVNSQTLCQTCAEVENMIIEEKKEDLKAGTPGVIVQPAFSCDEWHVKTRTCFLNRNIGDTLTFVLAFKHLEGQVPRIVWRQEFHVLDTSSRKAAIMNPDFPVWNVVIGSQGREFRISPVSEVDVDFNRFSATVHTDEGRVSSGNAALGPMNKVTFQIRTVPIDLGFVYPGEAIMLNLASFVSLPQESMTFRWYLERDGESGTLPSNMKASASGGAVAIAELRKEQEGVLACSVYTNKGVFATKKRFLIKELVEDVLMSMNSYNKSIIERRSNRLRTLTHRAKRQLIQGDPFDQETAREIADDRNTMNGDISTLHLGPMRETDQYDPPVKNQQMSAIETSGSIDEGVNGQLENDRDIFQHAPISSEINSNGNAQANLLGFNDAESQPLAYDERPPLVDNLGSIENPEVRPEAAIQNVEFGEQPSQLLSQEYPDSPDLTQNRHHNQHAVEHLGSDDIPVDNHMYHQGSSASRRHHAKTHQRPHKQHPKDSTISRIHVVENHGERDLTLEIFKQTNNKEVKAEDEISRLMAHCRRDTQCSGYGVCVHNGLRNATAGFCRCLPGYHGNGIFCWEDVNVRIGPVEDENDRAVRSTEANLPAVESNRRGDEDSGSVQRKRRLAFRNENVRDR